MASSLIGSLRVALGLDTAQFESGAAKASQRARQTSSEITASFNSAKRSVEGLFAAFTVGLLADQIKKSLDYAGSIAEVAKTLGVTTTQLQTYRYAATQSGVAQDQLEVGLRRLSATIGKAELGSTAQVKAFNALGISVEQLKGKNTGQVFEAISDSLSKVTDHSQRAAVEMTLFGRSGTTLDNLLAPGSKRLNELAQAAQELGIVLSDQQIQSAEVTAHKLEAVKEVLAAQIAGVVANNASAILSLSSALASLTGEIVKFLGSNPQLALGIIGGLLGRRVGGLPGAAIGAIGGYIAGQNVANSSADQNMDPAFRKQQLLAARDALVKARGEPTNNPAYSVNGIQVGGGAGPDLKGLQDEFNKQVKLAYAAAAEANALAHPAKTGVDLPKFLSPPAKKAPADRSNQVLDQMEKQEIQAEQSILQAKQQLWGSSEDRLSLSKQLIEIEKEVQDKAVDEQVAKAQTDLAAHRITETAYKQVLADAEKLKASNAQLAQIKLQALDQEQQVKLDQALLQSNEQRLTFSIDALKAADSLATTQADHRRIQLQILAAEMEQERLQLEKNKLDAIRNGATKEEIANIQAQIDHLPTANAQQQSLIMHNTQGLWDAYINNLPHTVDQINESMQSLEVEGIQGGISALGQFASGWDAMRQAAISAIQQVISKLIELRLEQLAFKLLGTATGAIGGGGGGVVDLTGAQFAGELGHFASGGAFTVGGLPGTDRNMLSINGRPRAMVSHDETIAVIPKGLPGMKGGGLFGALSFLSPAAFLATHVKGFNPLMLLSPLAFLASKSHGFGDAALAALSPGGFALDKAFGGKSGHTFNFNVSAPNTGNAAQDRRTSLQQAADIRMEIAGAVSKGLI